MTLTCVSITPFTLHIISNHSLACTHSLNCDAQWQCVFVERVPTRARKSSFVVGQSRGCEHLYNIKYWNLGDDGCGAYRCDAGSRYDTWNEKNCCPRVVAWLGKLSHASAAEFAALNEFIRNVCLGHYIELT